MVSNLQIMEAVFRKDCNKFIRIKGCGAYLMQVSFSSLYPSSQAEREKRERMRMFTSLGPNLVRCLKSTEHSRIRRPQVTLE